MITRSPWPGWLLAAGVLALAPVARAAELDRYLPDETDTVCTLNVRQLLHAPVVKRFALAPLREVLAATPARQALDAVGLDPLQDVHRVILATWGDADDDKWMVIVHGRFDTSRAAAGLKKLAQALPDNLKAHQEDGHRYWEIVGGDVGVPAGKHGALSFFCPMSALGFTEEGASPARPSFSVRLGDAWFFAVIDKSTIVFAPDRKRVLTAIARAADGKRPAVKRGLRELIADCDLRQSVWFADAGGIEGGLTVKDDVQFQATLYAANLDAARQVVRGIDDLRTRLQGLVMLVAGNQKERSSLAGVVQSFKDTRQGRVVTLEARIPADVFDDLQALLESQAAPPPAPVSPTRNGHRHDKPAPSSATGVAERTRN